MSKVIVRCANSGGDVISKIAIDIDKIIKIKKGETVLIKPNICAPLPSSTGATTNPLLVEEVVKYVLGKSASPSIIESPIFAYDFEQSMKVTGILEISERYGIPLIDAQQGEKRKVEIGNGVVEIPEIAFECDTIINMPVLKTHVQTKVSLGIKNIAMGLSSIKGRHTQHTGNLDETLNEVTKSIIDKIRVTIIDGIVGMQGEGPTHGEPVKSNIILVGDNVASTDAVACKVMGINPADVGHIKFAGKLGLGSIELSEIEVVGEIPTLGFAIPPQEGSFIDRITTHPLASYIIRKTNLGLRTRTKPVLDKDLCDGCEICTKVCRTNALQPPEIDYSKCVGCLICLEVCPNHALKHESTLHKLFRLHR